jgi:hypothetical protein
MDTFAVALREASGLLVTARRYQEAPEILDRTVGLPP